MAQLTRVLAAVMALVLSLTQSSQALPEPTVKEIVDRYLEARGGLERIRSVHTLILRGPPRPGGRPGRWMARARPFYYLVGEPSPTRAFAEGFDGSHWEYYRDPGLVMRTSGAPAAAGRHTAYFDAPLVYFGEPGWSFELTGRGRVGADDVYWIGATHPDGFRVDIAVSASTWLIVANRMAAPLHAFGDPIETETRVSDYRRLNGALFPMHFQAFDRATGEPIEPGPGWATAEVNQPFARGYFAPPQEPDTPLARMLNGAYASREFPSDALLWYRDFGRSPATARIDTEAGVETLAYQVLKSGALATAIALLEANIADYPNSAAAHFGLGRAYRAAGREAEAVKLFRSALAIDPAHQRASAALSEPPPTTRR